MERKSRIWVFGLVLVLLMPVRGHADDGYRRIISLAPSITEVLYAVGCEDRIAGVTRYCTYPPEAKAKPNVGGYVNPSFEAILSLRPDRVLLLTEHQDLIAPLEKLGIGVTQLDHGSKEKLIDSFREIAALCGSPAEGEALARRHEERLRTVAESVKGRARPRVLLGFDRAASTGRVEMMIPGARSIFMDLLRTAGGESATGDRTFRVLSTESVLRLDPDAVVLMLGHEAARDRDVILEVWRGVSSIRAARTGQVHVITDIEATVPGPRLLGLAERLAALLHGDRPGGRR